MFLISGKQAGDNPPVCCPEEFGKGKKKLRMDSRSENKDIFEDVQKKAGYAYLSDLQFHKKEVWAILQQMSLECYAEEQIWRLQQYVFGKKQSAID